MSNNCPSTLCRSIRKCQQEAGSSEEWYTSVPCHLITATAHGKGKGPRPLLRSRRLLRFRRHTVAEKFDSLFYSLAPLPEIAPEIAFLFEPGKDRLDVQGFGPEACPQFARQDGRRNGRFWKCSHGIGGSQRPA